MRAMPKTCIRVREQVQGKCRALYWYVLCPGCDAYCRSLHASVITYWLRWLTDVKMPVCHRTDRTLQQEFCAGQGWCRSNGAECLAMQPPGRNMRMKEACITTCRQMTAALLPVLAPKLQQTPYIVSCMLPLRNSRSLKGTTSLIL